MRPTIDPTPAASPGGSLPDATWTVDPRAGELGFAVKEAWGLRTVRGVFGAYTGHLEVRRGSAAGELTIDAASLDTGDRRRDEHLRSAAFFDAEAQPRIVFTTTAVTARDGKLVVTGTLAIGSSRVPIEMPLDVEWLDDGGLRLRGTTRVSRRAAGLGWNKLGWIRDDVVLHARVALRRTSA